MLIKQKQSPVINKWFQDKGKYGFIVNNLIGQHKPAVSLNDQLSRKSKEEKLPSTALKIKKNLGKSH